MCEENITPKNQLVIELDHDYFWFNIEKQANQGEDAEPLLITKQYFSCLSVFDGLGGAGSRPVTIKGRKHTMAYFASQYARKWLAQFCKKLNKNSNIESTIKKELESFLREKFQNLDKYTPKSDLKSRMFKNFPTTMATVFLLHRDEKLQAISAWAGDSRCYLLTDLGLSVLSNDDTSITASSNLSEYTGGDAIIKNCLRSDQDFTINFNQTSVDAPCIFLTATDGCFAYLDTPFHFEFHLLDLLLKSDTISEWKDKIIHLLKCVSGDDFSMALLTVGFEDFAKCKAFYAQRHRILNKHIAELTKTKDTIEYSIYIKAINEEKLTNEKNAIWQEYKENYFSKVEEDK